jgi:hypothetical protein
MTDSEPKNEKMIDFEPRNPHLELRPTKDIVPRPKEEDIPEEFKALMGINWLTDTDRNSKD